VSDLHLLVPARIAARSAGGATRVAPPLDLRSVKVVIAPDKFAGTLTAAQAAAAIARGWLRARPGDDVVLVPMADGGEGTIDVVGRAVPGCRREPLEVADARARAVDATWLRLPDGRALLEAAEACGLRRMAVEDRNPRLTTTYGVGQLLASASAAGVTQIVIGLGGSATVDGGAGMATALGHRLLRADGNGVKVGAEYVRQLAQVELGSPLGVPVVAATDVTNPLLGPDGAAPVYGPQKGASPEDVPVLAQALTVLADVVERDVPGGPWRELPGAGAAGGLGFGLAAFCGAQLEGGAAMVGELVGLEDALAGADAVVTGEGAIDAQTAAGKVAAHLTARAAERGIPVLAVAGQISPGAEEGFAAVRALGPEGLERPAELLVERSADLAAAWG
jgi:glycerate kinase